MSRDRSLDEFLPDGAESDGEEEPTAPGDEGEEPASPDGEGERAGVRDEDGQYQPTDENGHGQHTGDEAASGTVPRGDEDATVDPARSTFGWSPGGEVCDGCDRVVSRRWRDGDRLVCEDCKEW